MKYSLIVLLVALFCAAIQCGLTPKDDPITDEPQAEEYLNETNSKLAEQMNIYSKAQWNYATNINDQTSAAQIAATKAFNDFQKNQSVETKKYDWSKFNPNNQRQFEKLAVIGTSALNKEDEDRYTTVTNNMESIYSTARVCVANKCDLQLDPDLDAIMASSTDYNELTEAWVNWRNASGARMRDDYITYYTLGNKAATLNKLPTQDFKTLDDLWLFPWETPDIKEQTAALWLQIKPLYQKIHAYVRMKLNETYPDKMPKDGTIPAHLLGNMWAQQWSNIMSTQKVDPYPDVKPIDVTQALEENYDTNKMFRLSEQFFVDLGLEPMTDLFWKNSVLDKKNDTDMVCHASAWDFYDGDDFRIKQCTAMNMEYLITTHHEMGHIQYYQQYKEKPVVYREGANPGFHEAIGDLLALSVSTPKHLANKSLLDLNDIDDQTMDKINLKFQLKMALDKVAFLPFGYIMDLWRWDVFSGKTSSNDLNRHWWELRGEYQGLSPPVKRSENDFDPGAKYHIPASVEYIRYFVSHILQFQFHQKLCSFSQRNESLHECDIDNDKEAGNLLGQMLEKGSSEKWPDQLEALTGSRKMDVQPLMDYFTPLSTFLDNELKDQTLGWTFDVNDYFTGDPNPTSNPNSTSSPNPTSGSTSKPDDSDSSAIGSSMVNIFSLIASFVISMTLILL